MLADEEGGSFAVGFGFCFGDDFFAKFGKAVIHRLGDERAALDIDVFKARPCLEEAEFNRLSVFWFWKVWGDF